MDSIPVTDLRTFRLKADANLEWEGGSAHTAWQKLVAHLKQADGCRRVMFARQVEHPDVGVLCIEWTTLVAAELYASSTAAQSILKNTSEELMDLQDKAVPEPQYVGLGLDQALVNATLTAPTTEVFMALGAELPIFHNNTEQFVAKMQASPPAGFRGAVCGEILRDITKDEALEGEVVAMLIGWDSVQAHLDAKGDEAGVISKNIQLLREKRRAVTLWHVSFKEQ